MKLKYYLRGLGAGILFSVLIFAFVVGQKEAELSDAEIIQRAKQLGMTEKSELSIDMEKLRENEADSNKESPLQIPETVTPDLSPTMLPTPTKVITPTSVPLTPSLMPTPTNIPTLTPTPTTAEPPTLIPTPTEMPSVEQPSDNEVVSAIVEIKSGMRSEDICILIENAGLIDNAVSLNAYLIRNGFAEQLRSGEFELNSAMTYEEIAKQLTW